MSEENKSVELTFTEVKAIGTKFPNFEVWSPKKDSPKILFGLLVKSSPTVRSKHGAAPFVIVCPANPDPRFNMPETKIFCIWATAEPKPTQLFDLMSNVKEGSLIQVKYKGQAPTKNPKFPLRDDYSVGEANQKLPDLIAALNKFYVDALAKHAAEVEAAEANGGNADSQQEAPPF